MLLDEDQEEGDYEKAPMHVTVLTAEYIASGLDDGDIPALEAAEDTRLGEQDSLTIQLKDAVVRTLGRLVIPTRTFTNWRIPSMRNVVAILADDAPAQEALLEIWREFSVPFKVMLYSGPFVIEGTMYSDDDDPPEFYRQAFRPIEDALISHVPDQEMEPIRVKLGLVNVLPVHGYHVENS
ncbi:MAG: hypothetical protein FJZ87_16820 [Chloroflexi bacterium]|nr:hypothetical protein [Chloroflexota bacterium]